MLVGMEEKRKQMVDQFVDRLFCLLRNSFLENYERKVVVYWVGLEIREANKEAKRVVKEKLNDLGYRYEFHTKYDDCEERLTVWIP